MIFDIYDHRINFTPEINGAVNTTYMGLDEHLIIFYAMLYKDRPVIERHLIDFIATLKYFSDHWERARKYALLAGFLVRPFDTSVVSIAQAKVNRVNRFNDNRFDELEIRDNDIYLIEFFLHAYSLIKRESRNFIESKEGFTYML